MAGRILTCPFCGFEFERDDALCHHGCPLGAMCNLARCPACDYEFPRRLPSGTWLGRLLRRGEAAAPPGPMLDSGLVTVEDLCGGERAEVVCLAGESPGRRNSLAVFGLVPGSEITLVQRQPSYVVQVGETVLALEGEVARDIVVRQLPSP